MAPSGTGKSTLLKKVMEDLPELEWSVSSTTRAQREGEVHGKNYYFISKEEFLEKRDRGEFIEWAQVHSNYYGTEKSFVDKGLKEGKNLLFDLDVQGCDSIKKIYGDTAEVIFIEPPSVDELEKRLRQRATEPSHVIEERLKNAKSELTRKDDFDHTIINDDFEHAYTKLKEKVIKIINS